MSTANPTTAAAVLARDQRDALWVLAAEDLAPLLRRWRDQIDHGVRDQTIGDDPLTTSGRGQIDADLDARLVVDRVLASVGGGA